MQLSNLDVACTYFTLKYEESLPETVNLKRLKSLVSETVPLDKKFEERDYARHESGIGVFVRKQFPRGEPRKICAILEKEKINLLHTIDHYYYYVIYRNRVLHKWSEFLDLKKYCSKPGIYIPFSILKHIEKNNAKHHSEIVLMLHQEEESANRLLRIKSYDMFKYFTANKMPIMVDSTGQYVTGLPLELMSGDL